MPNRRLVSVCLAALSSSLWSAASSSATIPQIQVSVTDKACVPMTLNVPAGKVQFMITNKSMRALEWEILKGVIVVAERENIAPGFYQKMTVNLEPGEYETTCGLLTNPHGTLTVSGDTNPADHLTLQKQIQIASEYKFYLIMLTRQLVSETTPPISKDWNRAYYYQVQTLAHAYSEMDDRDLSDATPEARHAQALRWQKAIRHHTLMVTDLIHLFQETIQPSDGSADTPVNPNRTMAIQTNLSKLFDLLLPSVQKAAPKLAQQITQHMAAWERTQLPEARQKIQHDLQILIELIQQGGE